MTKKNNKVEKVNVVNNSKVSAKDILVNLQKETSGFLKTSLGTKRESIYQTSIFENCSDKEKKSLRKKLRNMLFSLCSSLIDEKDDQRKNKLIKSFNDFYKSVYVTNDYTLQSVCNENLKTEKKEILQKGLDICKK
jgi:hypothetical protein|nr:MAG TPA: hypothetical protein [Caudoviricetes sp.]